jgi:hypothetical protein
MFSDERLILNGSIGLKIRNIRNTESKFQKYFEEIHTFNGGRIFDDVTQCIVCYRVSWISSIFILHFSSEMLLKQSTISLL